MFDGKPTFVTGPNRSELRLSPELTQLLLKNNQEDVVLAGNGFNQWCAGPAYEISQVQHILGSAELVRSFAPLAPRCVRCSPRREWSIPIVGIGLLGLFSWRRSRPGRLVGLGIVMLASCFATGFITRPTPCACSSLCGRLPWATSDAKAFYSHNVWEAIRNDPEHKGASAAREHLRTRVESHRSNGPADLTLPVGRVLHPKDWDTTWIQLDLADEVLRTTDPGRGDLAQPPAPPVPPR